MTSATEFDPAIQPRRARLPLDESTWPWKAFERFCPDVVAALPDVAYAEFQGDEGDPQEGVDIFPVRLCTSL